MTRGEIDMLLKEWRDYATSVREDYYACVAADPVETLCDAIEQLTTWRPMETAPRDGTRILVIYEDGERSIGRAYASAWDDKIWARPFRHTKSSREPDCPIGWLPLVPEPKAGA